MKQAILNSWQETGALSMIIQEHIMVEEVKLSILQKF